MKKSTAFLKKKFRKEFSRDDNYRIAGRKLGSLLDDFTYFVQTDNDLLDKENRLLSSCNMDNVVVIDGLKEDSEAKDKLIEAQSEIIMDQTTDLMKEASKASKHRAFAVFFAITTLILLASYIYNAFV